MRTPGQNTGRLVESGGRSAMNFMAAIVTRPVAPTITLYVRRRDSHHRKMLAVLRTSAGAGKSKRVRADTPVLRTVNAGKIHPGVPSIKYFTL
jgi:hypothetical protein